MDTSPAGAPRAHESVVVSPEMTILIGRGPIGEAAVPADALAIAYGMGAINAPATLTLVGRDQVPALLAEDAGATRVVLLVAPNALNRIGGQTRPDAGERRGFHLPTELRGIGLALRDCGLSGEAGDIYRAAKAIELLFETWRLLDAQVLSPVAGESALSEADSLRLVQARSMIDERWNEKLSLDGIARQCGLNREKLTRGFREMFACSVAEAISERRLVQASQMLLTTDLPVSSIGYENGYMNNASFARAFGRRFGVTPSDFRAQRLAA